MRGVLSGDRRTITRTISMIENGVDGWEEVQSRLYGSTGRAYRLGVTGPPGAGKSTLVQKLIAQYRVSGKLVAVIAIDPTSPFTGGAILGDRVRMQSEAMRDGVFIRSMATRGSLGGLNSKAHDVADLLDAAGFEIIVFETVGVGQSELDVARAADSTVVVLVPESGDSIQAMKSGLMEIADLFVVNKADRDGADQAVAALKTILSFRITHAVGEWIPEVIRTVATDGLGIVDVVECIESHRRHLSDHGELDRRRQRRERQRTIELTERFVHSTFWTKERTALLDSRMSDVANRHLSPLQLARILTT